MKFEKRFIAEKVELRKAASGAASLKGYAAVYNSRSYDLGGFTEIIAPGAFDQVLADGEDVIATALDHEGIIGRTMSKTLRLGVDQRGLYYEVDLPDTQAGRDIAVLVERGDVRGSSFGFHVPTAPEEGRCSVCGGPDCSMGDCLQYAADGSCLRTVKMVDRLRDVGPVVNPAYGDTEVNLRALELARKKAAPIPFPEERLKRQISSLTPYKKP